jgi:hypothetical protein
MFDKQNGQQLDLKYLEEKTKILDTKFKVLAEFAKEAENTNCDMLLFKNVLINKPKIYRNYCEIWLICKMN